MQAFAQESFYKGDEIREVKLRFYQANWDEVLDSLYIKGQKERILADVFIDGIKYDSVGVRYKGYSSASINRVKNPFNIKLNYRIKGQKHLGIDKLKLSNVIQDPSLFANFYLMKLLENTCLLPKLILLIFTLTIHSLDFIRM